MAGGGGSWKARKEQGMAGGGSPQVLTRPLADKGTRPNEASSGPLRAAVTAGLRPSLPAPAAQLFAAYIVHTTPAAEGVGGVEGTLLPGGSLDGALPHLRRRCHHQPLQLLRRPPSEWHSAGSTTPSVAGEGRQAARPLDI